MSRWRAKLRAVHVDPVKLGAALLELISNAREALIGGGQLVLRSAPGRRTRIRLVLPEVPPGAARARMNRLCDGDG
ncbi:MAG: hypothetical protein HWE37_04890, partial [Rhodobacteraceae bacterium]|nr:hypothetical protein [Paracoccaceae bacterium]